MKRISVLGIDLAKHVFVLHGNDSKGKCVLKKKIKRGDLSLFVSNLPQCTVVLEACSSSHYWARTFRGFGHKVLLIPPQYVKPFVKTNKNDAADAEAIAEAAVRPNMRFVPIKETWQQDVQVLHRSRTLLVAQRVALTNAIRGLLHDQGYIIAKKDRALEINIPIILENTEQRFSNIFLDLIRSMYGQYKFLKTEIDVLDKKINAIAKEQEPCRRLQEIPGIGPKTATAIVAAVGDAKQFKNGRQLAAWLGLVPKQYSSGGKEKLLGISKRGDKYIRCLLIHGARAVAHAATKYDMPRKEWINEKLKTKGSNVTAVALANRNVRVIWALLAKNQQYKRNQVLAA